MMLHHFAAVAWVVGRRTGLRACQQLLQLSDLQLQQPQIFESMKQELLEWEKDKMKPIWTEGAVWDTITLMIHDDLMNNRKVRVHNPEELDKLRLRK